MRIQMPDTVSSGRNSAWLYEQFEITLRFCRIRPIHSQAQSGTTNVSPKQIADFQKNKYQIATAEQSYLGCT